MCLGSSRRTWGGTSFNTVSDRASPQSPQHRLRTPARRLLTGQILATKLLASLVLVCALEHRASTRIRFGPIRLWRSFTQWSSNSMNGADRCAVVAAIDTSANERSVAALGAWCVCHRTDEGHVGAQPVGKRSAMTRTAPHPNNGTTDHEPEAWSRPNVDAQGLTRIKGFLGSPS